VVSRLWISAAVQNGACRKLPVKSSKLGSKNEPSRKQKSQASRQSKEGNGSKRRTFIVG